MPPARRRMCLRASISFSRACTASDSVVVRRVPGQRLHAQCVYFVVHEAVDVPSSGTEAGAEKSAMGTMPQSMTRGSVWQTRSGVMSSLRGSAVLFEGRTGHLNHSRYAHHARNATEPAQCPHPPSSVLASASFGGGLTPSRRT